MRLILEIALADSQVRNQVLQRTGFTFSCSHLPKLWALTPLVSPFPLAGWFRFCGTFPKIALGCR